MFSVPRPTSLTLWLLHYTSPKIHLCEKKQSKDELEKLLNVSPRSLIRLCCQLSPKFKQSTERSFIEPPNNSSFMSNWIFLSQQSIIYVFVLKNEFFQGKKRTETKIIFHVVIFPVVVSFSTPLLNPQEGILRICRFFSAVAVKLNPSCPPGLFYCGLRWKRDGKPAGKLYLLRRLEKYFPSLCIFLYASVCGPGRELQCVIKLEIATVTQKHGYMCCCESSGPSSPSTPSTDVYMSIFVILFFRLRSSNGFLKFVCIFDSFSFPISLWCETRGFYAPFGVLLAVWVSVSEHSIVQMQLATSAGQYPLDGRPQTPAPFLDNIITKRLALISRAFQSATIQSHCRENTRQNDEQRSFYGKELVLKSIKEMLSLFRPLMREIVRFTRFSTFCGRNTRF